MSQCVYIGVLLQHTCYRYLCSLITTVFRGTHIIVTPDFICKVLCVLRVAHPNYPNHSRFWSISRDELTPHFCKRVMLWGDLLNFTTHDFAKGPRILNMVMTFVLIPWSHYNTITELGAHFLFSLLEGLTIDIPSHMIISMIDIYQDTATRDKLIFPSAITCILTHMHVTIPSAPFFSVMGAITQGSL